MRSYIFSSVIFFIVSVRAAPRPEEIRKTVTQDGSGQITETTHVVKDSAPPSGGGLASGLIGGAGGLPIPLNALTDNAMVRSLTGTGLGAAAGILDGAVAGDVTGVVQDSLSGMLGQLTSVLGISGDAGAGSRAIHASDSVSDSGQDETQNVNTPNSNGNSANRSLGSQDSSQKENENEKKAAPAAAQTTEKSQ